MLGSFLKKAIGGRKARPAWDLSTPLLRWSDKDVWTIRNALEGTLVLGATGSGKTTGSGALIARSFLSAGFGGLILTAKADELATWTNYCRETGRLDDLLVFGASEPLRFNFMQHELERKGSGAGHTENIVNLFSTVLEIAERSSGSGSGREDENYWRRANRQLMRNLVDLLVIATGSVSIPELYALAVSAPMSAAQIRDPAWQEKSLCFQCLKEADKRPKTPRQEHDFAMVADYFMLEFPNLSDKTRSVIVSTFTSMVDVLNRGILRELFCEETNITPEAVQDGKIILVNLPVKEFAEVGQFAQVLWKYTFQRSIERRNVAESPRPVFLFADESHHFITSYDTQFATTCRAARVAMVLLTQNVSNFYAVLGGDQRGKVLADSLFGNLAVKIFHANGGDPVTGEWAASLIGRSRQFLANGNSNYSPDDQVSAMLGLDWLREPGGVSAGFSETYEFEVQPAAFTRLRTGGPGNGGIVDGIVFRNGSLFHATGRSWLPVTFKQKR